MSTETLSVSRVFRFWLPLAGTWLMMAVEGPLLAAVIARQAQPAFNLAAFGVTYSLALIVEAPVIMMLSASTAIVAGPHSYRSLRRFMHGLNAVVTLAMLIIVLPPLFDFAATRLLDLPEEVARRTHIALLVLLPWPGTIGYRRFYQGIMIRCGQTRKVAYGTVVRLLAMATTAFSLAVAGVAEGAVIGAAALSAGVCVEALASRIMAASAIRRLASVEDDQPLGLGRIASFYTPLALTSLIGLAIHPLVTLFMGHSRCSLQSLAVLPVLNSLVFVFRSMGLAAQEVFIALAGEGWSGLAALRRFARWLAAAVVTALTIIAWSPLSSVWFVGVSGLEPELARFAVVPLRILALMPGFTVWLSWQRAMLVNHRHTTPVSWATGLELVVAGAILSFSILALDLVGVMAAALALGGGRLAANLCLDLNLRRLACKHWGPPLR